jgi:hypothetical protein
MNAPNLAPVRWWTRNFWRHYLSSECRHGMHGYCPLSCNVCGVACRCTCHVNGEDDD